MQILSHEVDMLRLSICVLLLALALPAAAADPAASAAENKPGVRIVQEPDKVIVRKKTVIDFNDVTVEGELTKPEGSYLQSRSRTRFRSLIRLRDNFNPELQKSADNL
ncbi:MAG: hypothetical protein ACJ79G_02350 [Myxococcales bacterium]